MTPSLNHCLLILTFIYNLQKDSNKTPKGKHSLTFWMTWWHSRIKVGSTRYCLQLQSYIFPTVLVFSTLSSFRIMEFPLPMTLIHSWKARNSVSLVISKSKKTFKTLHFSFSINFHIYYFSLVTTANKILVYIQ